MRAQRVREGESRVEMQAAKWTAEGAVNSHYFESAQYSATWGIRQLREYAGIPQSAQCKL